MKWRTKALLLLASLVLILVGGRFIAGLVLQEAPHILSAGEEALKAQALEVHHDAVVVDGHNDVVTRIIDFGFNLGMNGNEPGDRNTFLYEGGPFTWLPRHPRYPGCKWA